MRKARAYKTYEKMKVQTSDPMNLILMLYRGGIKFLKIAENAMEKGDFEKANKFLIRTQNILNELRFSLDMDNGGEVADNLSLLYDFMYRQLIEANIKKNKKNIIQVRDMFDELLESWTESLKIEKEIQDYSQMKV